MPDDEYTYRLKLDDEYTVILKQWKLKALRHGEPWRDLDGDHLMLALVEKIRSMEILGTYAIYYYDNNVDDRKEVIYYAHNMDEALGFFFKEHPLLTYGDIIDHMEV
jgi:hypothetical protein